MDKMLVSNGPGADLTWEYNNIFFDVNNIRYRTKILDIGPWNCDAVFSINVEHGLTFTDIFSITGYIRSDNNMFHFPISNYESGLGGAMDISILNWFGLSVTVHARFGGSFDNAGFSSVAFNRGKLFITYTF